jgi:hypothetical protein
MKKTIAELIDELSITNVKIALLIEKNGDGKKIQQLNRYRSELKNAITEEIGGRMEIKT